MYDWVNKQTYISHGIVDEKGEFTKKAYEESFLRFDNELLWDEAKPSVPSMDMDHGSRVEAYIAHDDCLVGDDVDKIVNAAQMWDELTMFAKFEVGHAALKIAMCEIF